MADRGRSLTRKLLRVVRVAAFPVIVVAVFVGILPRIADLGDVWRVITNLSAFQVAVLVVLALWNLVTYWPMLVAAMPGLTLGQAAVVCQTSTTVAMTVPAGGAIAVGVSYRMYTSWGFTPAGVALSAMVTFVANMSFKLLLPAVSLALLAVTGDATGYELPPAVVGVAVFLAAFAIVVLALRSHRFARTVGAVASGAATGLLRLVGRPPAPDWGESAVRFRGRIVGLMRTRGAMLAAAELVSQLSVFLVLLAAVRFTGTPQRTVTWVEVLAVFAFVRLATSMPIIPGNVGIAELGYIGGLVLAGGSRPQVVAAVLVFRFLTYFAQIPIGGLTYLVWRRRRSWRVASEGGGEEHAQRPEPREDAAAGAREHEGHPA